ncbi:putative structure protein [Chaetoceros tenuissimus associated DNA virus]|nr:putative structure protein [Chaetoceros tenuissimus associated DNA virus]
MPYWNQKKTNALIRSFRKPYNNMRSTAKNIQWHKKQSRSILSRYHQTHPQAKVSAWEFKKLEKQVRKNMAEKHTLRINNATKTQAVSNANEQTNVDITAAVKSYALFREHVLGDKFRFKGFNIRMVSGCRYIRCILYRSKRTASLLDLTGFSFPYTAMYDNSPIKAIYFDKTYVRNANEHSSPSNPNQQWVLNLNKALNFTQVINSDNGDLTENPPLRLLIIARGTAGDATDYSYEVTYQNV